VSIPNYSVEVLFGFSDDAWAGWDRFVADCPEGHPEQTFYYASVKSGYGWQPVLIQIKQDQNPVAGVVIHTRRMGRRGIIGYIERGPVVYKNDSFLVQHIINELQAFAKKNKILYLVVLPPYSGKPHA
jgi:lipid II:glycine glycyltransferase (peptidoglycan interpeptide bridge formation enzyme)